MAPRRDELEVENEALEQENQELKVCLRTLRDQLDDLLEDDEQDEEEGGEQDD